MALPKKSQIELGFNHNIKYKGKIFHVQTEDSGVSNPHITTHLFEGGNILATKKTSYADIIQAENLPDIVRELMQEQHKAMLRNLINGAYDGMGVIAESEARQPSMVPSAPSPPPSPPTQKPPIRGPVPIPSVPGPLPKLPPSYTRQPAYNAAPPLAAVQPNPSKGTYSPIATESLRPPGSPEQTPARTAASAPPKQPSPSAYSLVAGAAATLKETVHLTPLAVSVPGAPRPTTTPPVQPALASGKFPLPSKPLTPSTHSPDAHAAPIQATARPIQPPPLPGNISPAPLPQTVKGTIRQDGEQQRAAAATNDDLSIPPEVLVARRMVDKPILKDTSGPTIFGEDLVTEKSLDDVILSYLSGEGDKSK